MNYAQLAVRHAWLCLFRHINFDSSLAPVDPLMANSYQYVTHKAPSWPETRSRSSLWHCWRKYLLPTNWLSDKITTTMIRSQPNMSSAKYHEERDAGREAGIQRGMQGYKEGCRDTRREAGIQGGRHGIQGGRQGSKEGGMGYKEGGMGHKEEGRDLKGFKEKPKMGKWHVDREVFTTIMSWDATIYTVTIDFPYNDLHPMVQSFAGWLSFAKCKLMQSCKSTV